MGLVQAFQSENGHTSLEMAWAMATAAERLRSCSLVTDREAIGPGPIDFPREHTTYQVVPRYRTGKLPNYSPLWKS
eukprot:SAG11_NODE_2322_length_3523_cov_12.641063_5_plen_76_part_00